MTQKTAKKASATTTADQLAAEANPPTPPKGAPTLLPLHKHRRRHRPKIVRALLQIQERYEATNDDALTDGSLESAADALELLADIEDIIIAAAADPKAAEEWAAKASDEELMALLEWYTVVMQPGEAMPSSPSSTR